jgi:glycosyltransferase involved in cell wall biosynthesis
LSDLDDVLVVTVRKSFWASREAEIFPHRVYAHVLYGHSTQLVNSLLVAVRALFWILVRRPRVVLLGSVERTVPWFIRLRRHGLLGAARLVVTNQLHLGAEQLASVERNIVYSRTWLEQQSAEVRRRATFVPLPADGDLRAAQREAETLERGRVFSGGGAGRDFASLIEAVRGTDVSLDIVTFSPATLGFESALPANCRVNWRMTPEAFLARMAASLFVVVPLREPESDFGQTTLVQALALGKAVVATRAVGIADYITDRQEGLLVDAGDVSGYREAILRLAADEELRRSCELGAAERARALTYAAFAERLRAICREALTSSS